MKLCVVIDGEGNIVSLHEPPKNKPTAGSSQVVVSSKSGGKVLSLDAPRGLKGMPLADIHEAVYVDFSKREPALRRKKS